jgi:hypothetical protein
LIGFKGGYAVGQGDSVLSAKREKATAMYTSTFNQNVDNIKGIKSALANTTTYGIFVSTGSVKRKKEKGSKTFQQKPSIFDLKDDKYRSAVD